MAAAAAFAEVELVLDVVREVFDVLELLVGDVVGLVFVLATVVGPKVPVVTGRVVVVPVAGMVLEEVPVKPVSEGEDTLEGDPTGQLSSVSLDSG
jgi:hypothetical protein